MTKTAVKRPDPTNRDNVSVAEFLTHKFSQADRTQTEIAQMLGYANPNIITMFKQGKTKVPIPKVADLANALDMDPVHLMRIVMNEYSPETWKALERVLGKNLITDTEMSIVQLVRDEAGGYDVSPQNDAEKEELKELARKWKARSTAKVIRHH